MSPPRSRAATLLLLPFLALASPVQAESDLRVRGEVASVSPRLEVRVLVENAGTGDATPLTVSGELLGQRREARLTRGVGPGGEGAVILDFDATKAAPGVHALDLLLEHPVEGPPDVAGRPPVASQRAVVLVAVGPPPPEAFTLQAVCDDESDGACVTTVDVEGPLTARLESVDGEAHRVRVRLLTARGLRPKGGPIEVQVPPSGVATARVPVARAGAARGSRHGVLLVAEATDPGPVTTAVAAATVGIRPEGALVPRLRWLILGLGLALLAAAGLAEWRHARRPPGTLSPGDPTPSGDPGP